MRCLFTFTIKTEEVSGCRTKTGGRRFRKEGGRFLEGVAPEGPVRSFPRVSRSRVRHIRRTTLGPFSLPSLFLFLLSLSLPLPPPFSISNLLSVPSSFPPSLFLSLKENVAKMGGVCNQPVIDTGFVTASISFHILHIGEPTHVTECGH